MSEDKLPELGKIHPAFFDRVIYPKLGAASRDVVIGPRHGVDYGVIRVGGRYMALSTDPFFIVPSFGFSKAAWFGFHIVFCDVAVSGLAPRSLAIAVGGKRDLRGPDRVKKGDRIIITKGPAIETTGLLAVLFPEKFIAAGGAAFQKKGAA